MLCRQTSKLYAKYFTTKYERYSGKFEMNEQKTKKIKSYSQDKSPQRRVSFSKPWTPINWPIDRIDHVRSRHGFKDKAYPVPHGVSSRSILAKPSLCLDKSQSINKGVCARIKKYDASSSTTVDTRSRSQSDPTPTHLKYGMFRRFSKHTKHSDIIDVSPSTSPKRRNTETKPILLARNSLWRQESTVKVTELPSIKRSIARASFTRVPPPPARPQPNHVLLSRTAPIHLDIKPKRFPSMFWCYPRP